MSELPPNLNPQPTNTPGVISIGYIPRSMLEAGIARVLVTGEFPDEQPEIERMQVALCVVYEAQGIKSLPLETWQSLVAAYLGYSGEDVPPWIRCNPGFPDAYASGQRIRATVDEHRAAAAAQTASALDELFTR